MKRLTDAELRQIHRAMDPDDLQWAVFKAYLAVAYEHIAAQRPLEFEEGQRLIAIRSGLPIELVRKIVLWLSGRGYLPSAPTPKDDEDAR